jgi:hypothetical protein
MVWIIMLQKILMIQEIYKILKYPMKKMLGNGLINIVQNLAGFRFQIKNILKDLN